MIRLEPMDEGEFSKAMEALIARNASKEVERGEWAEADALAASREEFARMLPQGRETPGCHYCKAIDVRTGQRVGETLFVVRTAGGKVQFWVDWIWIEPEHRRQGHATDILRELEAEAGRRGADRIGLHVVPDNAAAMALYEKLGFRTVGHLMRKPVHTTANPRGSANRTGRPSDNAD
jgi:ribosomal protein S18 acetylase RimI-like enzyme